MSQALEKMLHDIKQAEKTEKQGGLAASRPTSAASVQVSYRAERCSCVAVSGCVPVHLTKCLRCFPFENKLIKHTQGHLLTVNVHMYLFILRMICRAIF
jgi:hypothetical protein